MIAIFLAAVLGATPSWAESKWSSYPEGLAAAKSAGKDLLVDFSAPWCYSCYYMDGHVLSGEAFAKAAESLVLVRVDVDSPEGRELKARFSVNGLPTYLVLDAREAELGRVYGEQTEVDFLERLAALAGSRSRGPEEKARLKLESFLLQRRFAPAASWRASLPRDLAGALDKRPEWRLLSARLDLSLKPDEKTLLWLAENNRGCDLAYDAADGLKAKPSAAALAAVAARLETLADHGVFGPREERCADRRSVLETLAGIYEAQGAADRRSALLSRAVAAYETEDAASGLGTDRNLDDDLRFFLDLAGEDKTLEALYPRLAEAYPSDYVYAHRFAKWLAARKRWPEALGWIEKADRLCYGANRLAVTKTRAEVLANLGRRAEAVALLRRDLKNYGKAFPEAAEPLEAALKVMNP